MISSSLQRFWEKLVQQEKSQTCLVCSWTNCSVVSTSVLYEDRYKTEYEHKFITAQFIQIIKLALCLIVFFFDNGGKATFVMSYVNLKINSGISRQN